MFEIEKETLETHEVMLTVTIDDETKQQIMKKAARKIARHINIPGFRRGRAPYQVIERYVGASTILDEALDDWLDITYSDILQQVDLDPYGPGKLISKQESPLAVKLRVPLIPTVDLGDYRSLRVEWQDPEISEEEISAKLDELLEQYAVLEPVERPAAWGDLLLFSLVGMVGDETIFPERDEERPLEEGEIIVVPGIAEEIVGMQAGEEKTFTLTLPDDILPEDLRGEEASWTVHVYEVYNRQMPKLDDAFALTVGNFHSLDELKTDIRRRLYEKALAEARAAYGRKALAALTEMAEVLYPPEMVSGEILNLYHSQEQRLGDSGISIEDFLRLQGKTKEQYYTELRPQAVSNIEIGLVLDSFIRHEQIVVTKEELEAHPEYAEAHTKEEKERLATHMLEQKTKERLEMIARGDSPEAEKASTSEELTEDMPEA